MEREGMNGFEALEKTYTAYYTPKNTTTKQNRDQKRKTNDTNYFVRS